MTLWCMACPTYDNYHIKIRIFHDRCRDKFNVPRPKTILKLKWKPGQKIPTTLVARCGWHPSCQRRWWWYRGKWGRELNMQRNLPNDWTGKPSFLLLAGRSSISAHWNLCTQELFTDFSSTCPRFCVKSFSLDYSLQHGEAQLANVRSTAARSATKWSASSMACDSSWTWANPPIGARVISSHPRRRERA